MNLSGSEARILALPLGCCVILGNLSKPRFLTCTTGILTLILNQSYCGDSRGDVCTETSAMPWLAHGVSFCW